jgi:hypothetical protein
MHAMVQGKVDGHELVFAEVLHVLGLHVVGTQGLPYPEVLVRQEKLTYYTQLASVSKMVALFRSVKERHVQAQALIACEARHHDQKGGGGGGEAAEQRDECDYGNESSSSELKDDDRVQMETVVDLVKQHTARISRAGDGDGDSTEDRENAEHGTHILKSSLYRTFIRSIA